MPALMAAFRLKRPSATFHDWLAQLTPQQITKAIVASKQGTGIWRKIWDDLSDKDSIYGSHLQHITPPRIRVPVTRPALDPLDHMGSPSSPTPLRSSPRVLGVRERHDIGSPWGQHSLGTSGPGTGSVSAGPPPAQLNLKAHAEQQALKAAELASYARGLSVGRAHRARDAHASLDGANGRYVSPRTLRLKQPRVLGVVPSASPYASSLASSSPYGTRLSEELGFSVPGSSRFGGPGESDRGFGGGGQSLSRELGSPPEGASRDRFLLY